MACIVDSDKNGATIRLSLNEISQVSEGLTIAQAAFDHASKIAGDSRMGSYQQDCRDTVDNVRRVLNDAHRRIWDS